MGCERQALCIPREMAEGMLQPGLTFGNGEEMEGRLERMLANSWTACGRTCPVDAEAIMLMPLVMVENHADDTCFISRRREEDGDYFLPFSLGLEGSFLKDEAPGHAVLRILNMALGYTARNILQVKHVGFIQSGASRAEQARIAVVYHAQVDDPHSRTADGEHLKGLWMGHKEIHKLYTLDALTGWSTLLHKMRLVTGTLTGAEKYTVDKLLYSLLAG